MGITRRELVGAGLGAAACGAAGKLAAADAPAPAPAAMEAQPAEVSFKLVPIGRVERDEKDEKAARLRIYDKYVPGLSGLDGWSHAWVFYWFDKNDTPMKRGILQVHPRGNADNPLTGVFACRSPVRPNLIALSLVEVKSVKDGVVEVGDLDAFEGTPILDIKPYTRGPDSPSGQIRTPAWAGGKK